MPFRTRAQLLGDNAANGAAVPVSSSNPAGTGANNRGVGFGEPLTAAIANRPIGALADNDDILNARLTVFETTGLDAAYRLGALGVAGGGRVVTLDGGPLETVSTLATLGAQGSYNAHFLANLLSNSAAQGSGFVSVASEINSPPFGAQLDLRHISFNSSITVFAAAQAATLSPGGVAATLQLLSGGRASLFTGGGYNGSVGQTELLPGTDLIEVTSASGRGLYRLHVLSDTSFTVRRLDGTTPSFAANVAATIRLLRPALRSGSVTGGGGLSSDQQFGQLTLAGCPSATANATLLSLVPGAMNATGAVRGLSNALTAHAVNAEGLVRPALVIDAFGTIHSSAGPDAANGNTGTDPLSRATNFGTPGFLHRPFSSFAQSIGFAAYNYGAGNTFNTNFIGVTSLETDRATPSGIETAANYYAYSAGADTFSITGGTNPTSNPLSYGVGQLVEVLTPSTSSGIYRIALNAYEDISVGAKLLRLDGTNAFSGSVSGTLRFLHGTILGANRITLTGPGVVTYRPYASAPFTLSTSIVANALITTRTRDGSKSTALVLSHVEAEAPNGGAYLRCINRHREVFGIGANGDVSASGTISATRFFKHAPAVPGFVHYVDLPTKASANRGFGVSASAQWLTDGWNAWDYINSSGTGHYGLSVPIVGELPWGSTITAIRVVYEPYAGYTNNSMQVRLHRLANETRGWQLQQAWTLDTADINDRIRTFTLDTPIYLHRGLSALNTSPFFLRPSLQIMPQASFGAHADSVITIFGVGFVYTEPQDIQT